MRECFGTVCGLLGVSPEGVFSTSVQQAVMEKVKILMASSKESAVEVSGVFYSLHVGTTLTCGICLGVVTQ